MYERTKTIIIAGGKGTRWDNYNGIPKHLLEVDGEPLINRTIRLLKEYNTDIIVATDLPLNISGIEICKPVNTEGFYDADKFLSSSSFWNKNGRTVILYGDVYFSEEALAKIFDYAHPDWTLFGRIGASSFTGKNHGELFAISFYHDYIPEFESALRRVIKLYNDGLIDRNGGWEVYKAMIRLPDEVFIYHFYPLAGPRFVNIDDWTDDFDWPKDYEMFLEKRREAGL